MGKVAKVAATLTVAACHNQLWKARMTGCASSMPATAANDSCQPTSNNSMGLTANMMMAAAAKRLREFVRRARMLEMTKRLNMSAARTVEGAKPDSRAKPHRARSCAVPRRIRPRRVFPAQKKSPPMRAASRPTCSPLTHSRCTMPLSRNATFIFGSISPRQPSVMASATPAYLRSRGPRCIRCSKVIRVCSILARSEVLSRWVTM